MRRNPRFGLLVGTAMNMRMFGGMTANERRLGRFIRDGEGHPAPAAEAAPAPTPSPAEGDDFGAFESSLEPAPAPAAEQDSGVVEPAPADTDEGVPGTPPEPDSQGASNQQSIDELRADFQRQLEERDRELEALRQERTKPAEETPKQERKVGEAPNPDDYEFGEADSKFIADLAIYHADQRFEMREAQAQIAREVQELEDGWKTRTGTEEFKAKYPDFEEKVTRGGDRGTWDCTPIGAIVIKGSEVGGDVAYHLATNPAESKRIAALPPLEQVRELGRLEGRFLAENARSATPPPAAVTKAPPPPEGRARGAGGRFAVQPDTDDFAAFDAMADSVLTKKK